MDVKQPTIGGLIGVYDAAEKLREMLADGPRSEGDLQEELPAVVLNSLFATHAQLLEEHYGIVRSYRTVYLKDKLLPSTEPPEDADAKRRRLTEEAASERAKQQQIRAAWRWSQ
jgi:hypothetical protein